MNSSLWTEVDRYIADALVPSDPVLESALQASAEAGLPEIQVSANQGKLLHLLARVNGARRILEIGTLAGYSTIWLARALPSGGKLVTLELEPAHAAVAQANFDRAGISDIVDLRVGPAIDSLEQIFQKGEEPFDFIFIDADKASITEYFDWAIQLARPGSVIIVDNVVRNGAITDPNDPDPSVQGVRRFYVDIASEKRVEASAIQTVGSKGYDGFALALVTG